MHFFNATHKGASDCSSCSQLALSDSVQWGSVAMCDVVPKSYENVPITTPWIKVQLSPARW